MTQAEIKALAIEIIGDGQMPNKFFVTSSPWVTIVDEYGDRESELLDGYTADDTWTQVFDTYEEANDHFQRIELDIYEGVANVVIEDRLTGLIKDASLEQIIKVYYVQTIDNHTARMFGYEK